MDVVKLDFPDRDLFILKDGDWRGFRSSPCAKEPETVEWIRSFEPNSVLWDVGASVGPYSLIAAALGHEVDAFEPFAPSYGHLQQNVWINQVDVEPYPLAFGTVFGWREFRVSGIKPGMASHERGGEYGQWVLQQTADAFSAMFHEPDHVKIDVDGAELGVIEGGRETWKNVKSIMIESESPTVDDITVILQVCGLELVNSWKRMGDTRQHNYLYQRIS